MDGERLQVWNKNCFGCHVSQERKNFRPQSKAYATDWVDFGINCESCHGPGREHVSRYQRTSSGRDDAEGIGVVRPTRLDHATNSMVCAQCHSSRDVIAGGFTAGRNYYDFFLPLLEYGQASGDHAVYWADGRPRRFSNNALALWQSECFLRGEVACTSCHVDPHYLDIEKNPQLRPDNETLCTGCHAEIGRRVFEHTRHEAGSRGSSCVECHMPRTVVGIRSETMRDHGISVPRPENTIRHGIPNACTVCHENRDPEWALDALREWFPDRSAGRRVGHADAFAMARNGDPAAIDRLLAITEDPREGFLVRANATGHLGRFSDPRAVGALVAGLQRDHPLVRAVAALALGEGERPAEAAGPTLIEALSDPVRGVRMSAAMSLANLGLAHLAGEERERFDAARRDIIGRAELNNDDAEAQTNLGKFYLLTGEHAEARHAFRRSESLLPDQPSMNYLVALAEIGLGRIDRARRLLARIPSGSPFSEQAEALLKRLKPSPLMPR